MAVGFIGLDLGVTTGIAWGIWNPALRDQVGLWAALAKGRQMHYRQVHSEAIEESGQFLANLVIGIISGWNLAGMPYPDMRICIEDFQARPQSVRGGTRKGKLAPVYLAGAVEVELRRENLGGNIVWINPAMSMSKATDARLKDWASRTKPPGKMGWIKGKQHARDACRLVAVGLDKEI